MQAGDWDASCERTNENFKEIKVAIWKHKIWGGKINNEDVASLNNHGKTRKKSQLWAKYFFFFSLCLFLFLVFVPFSIKSELCSAAWCQEQFVPELTVWAHFSKWVWGGGGQSPPPHRLKDSAAGLTMLPNNVKSRLKMFLHSRAMKAEKTSVLLYHVQVFIFFSGGPANFRCLLT